MKKMFFGALLLLSSILGIIMFIVLSELHPWDYNNITGFHGYLLGSGTTWAFALFCIMAIVGIAICFYEAYIRK